MLANYLPILLFLIVSIGLGFTLLVAGKLLSPSKPSPQKNSPYECGFEAFEDARMKFDVRYYLVAILFILFDLEIGNIKNANNNAKPKCIALAGKPLNIPKFNQKGNGEAYQS